MDGDRDNVSSLAAVDIDNDNQMEFIGSDDFEIRCFRKEEVSRDYRG